MSSLREIESALSQQVEAVDARIAEVRRELSDDLNYIQRRLAGEKQEDLFRAARAQASETGKQAGKQASKQTGCRGMNAVSFQRGESFVSRMRDNLFPWAIAFATGLDYFDNAIFSFFTSYIAGGINASADELVWSANAYAVASARHPATAMVGRADRQPALYHRMPVPVRSGRHGGGAVAIVARTRFRTRFSGLFHRPDDERRAHRHSDAHCAAATRQRRARISVHDPLDTGLAPLLGGYLVAWFGWRALFTCTPPSAASRSACSRSSLCHRRDACIPSSAAMRISDRISTSRSRRARC